MNLEPYVRAIQKGQLVAFPTETVYGLGADAFNPAAIEAVFNEKGRPADNPLIVHIAGMGMFHKVVAKCGEEVENLLASFWPGPLTVILPKSAQISPLVTGGLDTVAVRMPDHPLALELIKKTGPLVAPSANKSGRPSPTLPSHVRDDFGPELLILDGGPTRIGLESTVLSCVHTPWQILRPGIVSADAIQQIGNIPVRHKKEEKEAKTNTTTEDVRSPGQKYRHYAPDATIAWLKPDQLPERFEQRTLYILHSTNLAKKQNKNNVVHFNSDLEKMATQLYQLFRYADRSGFKQIMIESFEQCSSENKWVEPLYNRIHKAMSNS